MSSMVLQLPLSTGKGYIGCRPLPGTKYIGLRWLPDVVAEFGLPDIEYPVPMQIFEQLVISGNLQLADMLLWLQDHSANSSESWPDYEPAISSLSECLMSDETAEGILLEGDNWSLYVGSVDLTQKIVTIQRGLFLIAALQGRRDGGLIVSAYRPLDAKSASILRNLSIKPAPNGTVCMRPNNWEYAHDQSAAIGNAYAAKRGEAYLSYWDGLGISYDGSQVENWYCQRDLVQISSKCTALQIRLSYEKSKKDGA